MTEIFVDNVGRTGQIKNLSNKTYYLEVLILVLPVIASSQKGLVEKEDDKY